MVLEKLITVKDALRDPYWIFIASGIISTVSLFISFIVFPSSVGLMTTFLITIASTPFILNLSRYEEAKEERELKEEDFASLSFFEKHKEILKIYTAFFLGMIVSFTIIFMILPESIVLKLFEDQINEINWIRGSFLGGTFGKIVFNNLGVLLVSFLFSFLYGAGAIFILAWNASVLATAIGLTAKSLGGMIALPLAVMVYFPHGSLELIAYFIGAIAGSLVSVALTKRRKERIGIILKDSFYLLLIAAIIILIAGAIETISIEMAS